MKFSKNSIYSIYKKIINATLSIDDIVKIYTEFGIFNVPIKIMKKYVKK